MPKLTASEKSTLNLIEDHLIELNRDDATKRGEIRSMFARINWSGDAPFPDYIGVKLVGWCRELSRMARRSYSVRLSNELGAVLSRQIGTDIWVSEHPRSSSYTSLISRPPSPISDLNSAACAVSEINWGSDGPHDEPTSAYSLYCNKGSTLIRLSKTHADTVIDYRRHLLNAPKITPFNYSHIQGVLHHFSTKAPFLTLLMVDFLAVYTRTVFNLTNPVERDLMERYDKLVDEVLKPVFALTGHVSRASHADN